VYVEAGVACPKLARFCARNQLTGAEFLAGIPGTLGGALAMNAGAFGGEIWPLVRTVETIDESGTRRRRAPEDYRIAYRSVQGPQREWFVAAQIELQRSSDSSATVRIKEMLERRAATQPMGEASCGSVFRNPPGDYAGRLIEACGLKGYCIGGACVSSKHANFIVTRGASATAGDIEALIEFVAQAVFEQHGVRLKTEVCIVGHKLGERS
ncbi:MAG: UDP-N-acetylmuramate dehydrogenase, partial [Gammaproteobacteria bacterium]|nr:UDP-N-acetylmuramate dehydrogenase [Gammaproteobacteria bacterium]